MDINNKEKRVIVYQDSIFTKIVKFFKNIFLPHQEIEEVDTSKRNLNEDFFDTKKEFLENLKLVDEEIYIIKKKLEKREIKIRDLKKEDKEKLITIYKKQIENDKIRIANLKRRLKFAANTQ